MESGGDDTLSTLRKKKAAAAIARGPRVERQLHVLAALSDGCVASISSLSCLSSGQIAGFLSESQSARDRERANSDPSWLEDHDGARHESLGECRQVGD